MTNDRKLLIVGNASSILTEKLKSLVGDYFRETRILDNRNFSVHKPFMLLKSVLKARKVLKNYAPSFIILYQIDIAAFFLSFINRKVPVLAVGIGSDVLIMPNKSRLNKFLVTYVLNHCQYFNAGSIAVKERIQQLSNRPVEVTIANLGVEDILPAKKQNIIFSNRLHKDLYNIDRIVNAFARFVKDGKRKDWKLVVAATGKEEELKNRCEILGINDSVDFVGWLNHEQNAYYYSISRIWVSLPASDSISLSLLEAMSAGCIPVCYDVPALKGFLFDNRSAVIVNDFNENFFERALLLDNKDILANNRRKARNFADIDLNRKRFYSIFDKEFNKQTV
ncbi:MAG: glycosyltransferase [Bacteroidales bacterium]|nr:glycosyltransferase [Bacteroidales bacterium]